MNPFNIEDPCPDEEGHDWITVATVGTVVTFIMVIFAIVEYVR